MIDKEKIIKNKNEAIEKISNYLDSCMLKDDTHSKKTNLISYWIKDYVNYIEQEETFNSSYLKSYSRGDVIKVNLGFNVGNEEGGLHYCVVLDKKNAKNHSTLTIIPLTSQKENSKPYSTSVFLGNDIYENLLNKYHYLFWKTVDEISQIKKELDFFNKLHVNTIKEMEEKELKLKSNVKKLEEDENTIDLLEKIYKELSQMKSGSIALINQITTISKQRIYNPKNDFDILAGVKLSDENMRLIDEKIKKLFVN